MRAFSAPCCALATRVNLSLRASRDAGEIAQRRRSTFCSFQDGTYAPEAGPDRLPRTQRNARVALLIRGPSLLKKRCGPRLREAVTHAPHRIRDTRIALVRLSPQGAPSFRKPRKRLSGIHFSRLSYGPMDSGFASSRRPGMTHNNLDRSRAQ